MKPAFYFVLVISQSVFAQQGDYSMGARSLGIGGADTALPGSFSCFNNQAGVCRQEGSSLLFTIRNLYSLSGLFAMGAAYNLKYRQGAFLLTLYRFGDQLFSEHKFGIGYSHQIRFVSLGIQVNYLQQQLYASGSRGSFLIEVGGMAEILPGVLIAAYLLNPNRATIGRESREPLPVMMKTGIVYQPDDKISVCLDVQHGPDDFTRVRLGMEYVLGSLVPLRSGVNFNPARWTFGFGIYLKKFTLDYAFSLDPLLGLTHEISVHYLPVKK